MVFGSSANSIRRTRLNGASRARRWRKIDSARRRAGGSRPAASATIGLRHRQPHRVGRGHHGGLGDGRVLDQHALQLERADAVVGRFEHVVGAADIGQVAVGVAAGDVAGAVDLAVDRRDRCRRRSDSRASAPAGGGSSAMHDLALRRRRGRRRRAGGCGSRAAAGPSSRASPSGPANCRPARWSRSGRSRRGWSGPRPRGPGRSLRG